jgi:virulence-associated protein VagC
MLALRFVPRVCFGLLAACLLSNCAEGRAFGMVQVRFNRWLPEGQCVDSSFRLTQTEHIHRDAPTGAQPFDLDQSRVLVLEGVDCTIRSDSVGLPAEFRFTVRTATIDANGTSTVVFAPRTRIFVHTTPQDRLTSALVTIDDVFANDSQLRFVQNFLMLDRAVQAEQRERLNGIRSVGDRRSFSETLTWPVFLPRHDVQVYRGRVSVSRLRAWHGIDAYELIEQATSPEATIDVSGDGMQVHGTLQETRHARHVHPLDVLQYELARDSTVHKTFRGTVALNGQIVAMQSDELTRSRFRFSAPFLATAQ